MQNHPGVFIVLEGSDGSGKGTQFRLLKERLKAVGHDVAIFDFPRYEEPSSHFIKRYLNGGYGPASEVSPYIASIFFALDRYEAAPEIKKALAADKVVLANRYVGSNMAHQGTRFDSLGEQRGFFIWAENLEFQLLGIPRPNLNLFLKVPAEISFGLIAQKAQRDYTKKVRDELEADIEHLKKTVATYTLLCKLFPKDFKEIDCIRNGQMQTIVEINNLIWEAIKPLLPEPKRMGKGAVISFDRPADIKNIKTSTNKTTPGYKRTQADRTKFYEILTLKEQMQAKAGSTKGVDRQQLEAAIDLVTPLADRKREIRGLIKEEGSVKQPDGNDPVALDLVLGQISESFPPPPADDGLKLVQARPRNEFRLLNETSTADLTYQQKQQLLKRELKNSASRLIYTFEAISDFKTLIAFRNESGAQEMELLAVSPLLGYKTPEIVEHTNFKAAFDRAFEASAKLFHQAVSSGYKKPIDNLLLGHNVRFKFNISASDLSKALKNSKKREVTNLLTLMRDKVAEIHPQVSRILAESKSVES